VIGRSSLLVVPFFLAALSACGSSSSSEDVASSSAALGGSARAAALDAIRQVEDHRLLGNVQLAGFLSSTDPRVLAAAATAVGRIGDLSLQSNVAALLANGHAEVRQAAAFALGLLGAANESALAARLAVEHDTATRATVLRALAHAGTATSVPAVTAAFATGQPVEVQTAAAEAYGTMVGSGAAAASDPAVLVQLVTLAGEAPELCSIAAAYALSELSRARTSFDEASLTAAFHAAASPSARAYLTRALASLGTTTAIQTIATASAKDPDERVRAAACAALGTTGASSVVLAALGAALNDPSSAVVVGAATAIGALGSAASSLTTNLGGVYAASGSAWVRATTLSSIAAVSPSTSHAQIALGLSDAWPVQLAAIAALPGVATTADVTTLTTLATGTDKRLASAAIEAITALAPALVTPAVKAAMTTALQTKDWEITSSVADVAVAFGWTDFAAPLAAIYPSFAGDGAMNGRIEIVWALGTIGSSADLPFLKAAVADDTVLVSQYAAASYKQLSGVDLSAQVRTENVVSTKTPNDETIVRALGSLVVLETTRGTIGIQMLAETPLNAVNFTQHVATGFYDGLPFHRVIPNFVAQGGDPRGDGSGGANALVRDELSMVPHLRGTVGLATEGKDTGSSQLFFNEGWNVSLDERYTVFGEVVFGIEAAEALEVGDTIVAATVLPGAVGRF
jgi:cyclophilin family peptidyl-prolyl cis-trans isomerase/HEAT repeat protein